MATNSTPPVPVNGNPYAPQEPASILYLEHCSWVGNNMGEILYGVVLVLFFQCAKAIIDPRHKQPASRKWAMLAYIFVLFALSTIFTAMNMHLNQLSYIDNRNFPTGPIGYFFLMYSDWRAVTPNAAYIVTNWLADGLLMYRYWAIYGKKSAVLIAPGVMYAGSITTGIITLYKSSRPDSTLWSGVTVNFGLPYFTISVALNIILTALICLRLFLHSRQMQSTLSRSVSLYRNIMTMLIESCALYSVISILFIGTYAANDYASDIFLPILSQAQVIAPYLVIIRVATHRSVTETSENTLNSGMSGLKAAVRSGHSAGTGTTMSGTYPLKSMTGSDVDPDTKVQVFTEYQTA